MKWRINTVQAVVLYLIAFFLPIVSQYTKGWLLAISVLMIVTLFVRRRGFNMQEAQLLVPAMILVVMEMVLHFVSSGFSLITAYSDFTVIIPVFLYILLRSETAKTYERLTKFVLLLCLITAISSIAVLWSDPAAARFLATGIKDEYAEYLNKRNVGGYDFIYSVVLLLPLIILMWKKKRLKTWAFVPLVVAIAMCVFLSNYAFALLLMIIASSALFFRKDAKTKPVWIVLIVVAIFAFSAPLSYGLRQLSGIISNKALSGKIMDVARFISGNDMTGEDGRGRLELYRKSWKLFLQHPLFGCWYKGKSLWGGHSFILDTMAKYGIIGLACIVVMYISVFKLAIKPFTNGSVSLYVALTFVLAIFLSFINTGMWLNILVVCLPIILRCVATKTEGENDVQSSVDMHGAR